MSQFHVNDWVEHDGEYWQIMDIEDDKLTIRSRDNGNEETVPEDDVENVTDDVISYDYITDEPIFDDDDYTEIFGFNRYGSVDTIGYVLDSTLNAYSSRFVECDDCHRMFDNQADNFDDWWREDSYTSLCWECYDDGYGTCPDCGCICRSDEMYYSDDDDDYYCEECYYNNGHDGSRNDHRSTHDYGYKPDPFFHRHDGGHYEPRIPFMGVELEIDQGSDTGDTCEELYDISDDENLFYLKHDGSLGYSGIEIVTHPCDLDYHLQDFPWDKIAEIATKHDYKSHNAGTCGLHVHLSRSALGDNRDLQDLNIAKIIILVDRFWDEMVKFSRRNYNQLDRWAKKPDAKIWSYDTQDVAVEKARNSGTHDRYKAVNLTNRNTVEFRMFRGTLKVSTIKATLQFLSNLIGYAMNNDVASMQEARWTDITRYQDYPELTTYLEDRGLTEVPDKPKPVEPKPAPCRFKADDVVWFQTDNTRNTPMRGVVQSVNRSEEDPEEPVLFIVEDYNGNVNFLIDDEIFDNDRAAELEARFVVGDEQLIASMQEAASVYAVAEAQAN